MNKASLPLVILLLAGNSAHAEPEALGRLFFTPEQRQVLERQRLRNPNAAAIVEDGTPLTLNGRVTRSSGRNTAWINGTPLDDQDARSLTPVPLRPGETTAGPGQGETTDLLNGGSIQIHRRNR